MNVCIRNVCDSDASAVVSIFNYFVLNSFAAYCEKEMGPEVFDRFRKVARVFLLLEVDDQPVGFGMIQEYNAFENFKQTGTLTYFILPGFTGQGLGTQLLNRLLKAGRELGITNLVAHISSKNEQSLRFHQKHGFRECGRLKEMGIKFNEPFDIVWVQKELGARQEAVTRFTGISANVNYNVWFQGFSQPPTGKQDIFMPPGNG